MTVRNLSIMFILIILGLIITYFFFMLIKTPASKTLQSNTNANSTVLNVPNLYPELSWTSVSTNDTKSLQNSLKGNILYKDYNEIPIPFEGNEWVATKTGLDTNQSNLLTESFKTYYNFRLLQNEWKQEIVYKGKNLDTINASRPGSNTWGYLRQYPDSLKVIILQSEIDYLGKSTSDSIFSCPCNNTFRIFVSNEIPISEIGN